MSGVYQLEIKETVEELKELLAIQKTATCKERVQLLYLLKTGHGQTISQTAQMIGRNARHTTQVDSTVLFWRHSRTIRTKIFALVDQEPFQTGQKKH